MAARLLKNLSVAQLQKLIAKKRAQERRAKKVAPLEKARKKLVKKLAKLDAKIAKLGAAPAGRGPGRPKKKRKISAKAIRAIVRAQKKRWAAYRKEKAAAAATA